MLAGQAVAFLYDLLVKCGRPEPSAELAAVDGFERLRALAVGLKEALFLFSTGDFNQSLRQVGVTAGYLKTIQSNIFHLTWQCQQLARGDLNQRVEFMGELSEAFNLMIEGLTAQRWTLEQQAERLSLLAEELKNEVRKKEEMADALRISEEMYRQKALRDPLTGLYNRGYFFEAVAREMETLKRVKDGHVCVLMLDIDYFKSFNDLHGHLAGDMAIKMVSAGIGQMLRKSDILARYGGEEFSVFLPHTTLDRGVAIAERIRAHIAGRPVPVEGRELPPVTISIGLHEVDSRDIDPQTPGPKLLVEALDQADEALYTAKKKGRNQVWVSAYLDPD